MRCKVMVGKKTLIPVQNVPEEIADMVLSLIKVKHPNARRVVLAA